MPFQNHGILVASGTIEGTLHFYTALEKSCHVQLLADAAASGTGRKPIRIDHEDAFLTHKTIGSPYAGWYSGLVQFQLLEAKEGVKFKFSEKVKL